MLFSLISSVCHFSRTCFVSFLIVGCLAASHMQVSLADETLVDQSAGLVKSPQSSHAHKRTPATWQLAWQGQTAADGIRGTISSTTPFLSRRNVRTVYEVVSDQGVTAFSPDHLGRSGERLGDDGAKYQADIEVRTLDAIGVKAELRPRQIPVMTLFVATSNGTLQAIDAETGRTIGTLTVGNGNAPVSSVGATDDFAAWTVGSSVVFVSLKDFKILYERPLSGIPGSSVAVHESSVYVSLFEGGVELFSMNAPNRFSRRVHGKDRIAGGLSLTDNELIWATETGVVYALDPSSAEVLLRAETRASFASSACLGPNHDAYLASMDGRVLAFDVSGGRLIWQTMTGEALEASPILAGDRLWVTARTGNLYCLDHQNGLVKFKVPGVSRLAAYTSEEMLAIDMQQRLVAFDLDSGARRIVADMNGDEVLFTNSITDRVYLTNGHGLIRCWRQTSNPWPEIHVMPKVEESPGADVADRKLRDQRSVDEKPSPEEAAEVPSDAAPSLEDTAPADDPFAEPLDEGADPFGGVEEGEDPFDG